MNDLISKIRYFEELSKSLETSKEQRDAFMKKILNYTNNFIEELAYDSSFNEEKVNDELIEIDSSKTKSLDEILSVFKKEVNDKGLRAASGGHVGYIPGGGIYTGAMGDFLAAVSNEYAGVSYASPGAVAIRKCKY